MSWTGRMIGGIAASPARCSTLSPSRLKRPHSGKAAAPRMHPSLMLTCRQKKRRKHIELKVPYRGSLLQFSLKAVASKCIKPTVTWRIGAPTCLWNKCISERLDLFDCLFNFYNCVLGIGEVTGKTMAQVILVFDELTRHSDK